MIAFQAELPRVRRRRPGLVPHRFGEAGQRLPLPEQCEEDTAERRDGDPVRCSDDGDERLQNLDEMDTASKSVQNNTDSIFGRPQVGALFSSTVQTSKLSQVNATQIIRV